MATDEKVEALSVDGQRRKLLVVWAAMLASLGVYVAIAYLLRPARAEEGTANDTVSLALLGAGAAAVMASFVVKNRILSRAVREQDLKLVGTAYVAGLALAEGAGLLGLVSAFALGGGFPGLLFLVSAAGMLFHFPRREDLSAASHDTAHGRGITGL
jgi:predicted MFS family arabinose efflux permease